MNQLIAYCGLNCGTCDARIATVRNDDALREKTAALCDVERSIFFAPQGPEPQERSAFFAANRFSRA